MEKNRQQNPFSEEIIAIIFDFDKTLIPYNMQRLIFQRYGVDEDLFWEEVENLSTFYKDTHLLSDPLVGDIRYLNHFLSYVKEKKMSGLSNKILREEGANLDFYPGVIDVFDNLKKIVHKDKLFNKSNIHLEFYVISGGFRQMILGSFIASHLKDVWGCEFIETQSFPNYLFLKGDYRRLERSEEISAISYYLDNTTKTRVLFELNKGTNINPSIGIDDKVSIKERRIPFENMIYIADGLNDIPVFSLLNDRKGKTFCVYDPNMPEDFKQASTLKDHHRVQSFGPANYETSSETYQWIVCSLYEIGKRIVSQNQNHCENSFSSFFKNSL